MYNWKKSDNRINQMYLSTKLRVFGKCLCFLLKTQRLLNYYLKISKISNDDLFVISTQALKKSCKYTNHDYIF